MDVGLTKLDLPLPNEGNCGGYRQFIDTVTYNDSIFTYSPIDICVAGLTSIYTQETIIDLSKWFVNNPEPLGEAWVTCTILHTKTNTIINENIAALKVICKYNSAIRKLLKVNAPFTFRRV